MHKDSLKCFQNNLQVWSKTCPKEAVLLPYIDVSLIQECLTDQNEPNLILLLESFSGEDVLRHAFSKITAHIPKLMHSSTDIYALQTGIMS